MKKANKSNRDASNSAAALDSQQLKRLRTVIAQATTEALFEVIVHEAISRVNQDILKADGYQVYRRGGRMGDQDWLILWKSVSE